MVGSLLGLALVLLVLAAAGGLLRTVGQSAIPIYILLGLATRHTLVADPVVDFVQAIGIALLLFFVGLEFSILRLRSRAGRLATAGAVDLAVNFPVGFVGGLLLGWTAAAAFLLGAALYISSSAIVSRNITDMRRAAYPETETALGILVAEDITIALALVLAALWLPLPGDQPPIAVSVGAVLALGLLLTVLSGPVVRAFDRLGAAVDDEALLLGVTGVLILFSGAALAAGLSEAIGAFAAGLLMGETRLKPRIQELLAPLGGVFAALFFFGFGLAIDAGALPGALLPGVALAAAALASKLAGGMCVGRLSGHPPAAGVNLGLTLVPRGEFSILLAAYGAAAGHPRLSAVIAVVVVVLAVVGTVLTQAGPRLGTRWAAALARWRAGETSRARMHEAPEEGVNVAAQGSTERAG